MSRLKKKLDESDLDITDLFDDSIEDKILTPEEERRKKIQHRLTAIAMCLAIVVIVGAIGISLNDTKDGDGSTGKDKKSTVKQSETAAEVTANLLKEDQYPEITELVQLYYDAKLKGDTASLEKYVDNIEEVNMEEIEASNEYIESYENIECYTKLGLYDNTYVVFVYYEIGFWNIQTPAPGIDVLYVIRDEEVGSVFIHNGATANADIKNYISALKQDADVVELLEKADNALKEALKADSDLNNLYKALRKGSVDAGDE